MDACADGAHSWTLRRISGGSEGSGISDFLGVCIGTADICLSAAPTSGSFKGFVAGFRSTAKVGGDLRYKGISLLQKGQRGLPTLDEDGSVLNITLDHEAGTVTLRPSWHIARMVPYRLHRPALAGQDCDYKRTSSHYQKWSGCHSGHG